MLTDDDFDFSKATDETRTLFGHSLAQSHFAYSFFWVRRLAAPGSEDETIGYGQTKQDRTYRGIVEIAEEQSLL